MTAVAALPALAVPAAVAAIDSPDAELIELGRRFVVLEGQYREARERSLPIWRAINEARINPPPGPRTDDEIFEFEKHVEREHGGPIKPSCDDINTAMDEPMRRIMALPAFTLAGLAVKAYITRFVCSTFYDESDDDADWDQLVVRNLIDAVLQTAGRMPRTSTMKG